MRLKINGQTAELTYGSLEGEYPSFVLKMSLKAGENSIHEELFEKLVFMGQDVLPVEEISEPNEDGFTEIHFRNSNCLEVIDAMRFFEFGVTELYPLT